MTSNQRGFEPQQLRDFRAQLAVDRELVDLILARPDLFPPVPPETERVIRCSLGNVDRAVCRALALAAVRWQVWQVEIMP
jgi:hypothetical protein